MTIALLVVLAAGAALAYLIPGFLVSAAHPAHCPSGTSRAAWPFSGRCVDHAVTAVWIAGPVTAVLIGAVGVAFLFVQGQAGLTGFITGKDNQLSTSKTQVALWTVALVFAFVFFLAQDAQGGTSLSTGFGQLGPEYLLLLGGPFAAAALASASTSSKAAAKQVQPVQATKPTAADLVTDTTGDPSLSDAQFLLFNLVALGWFAVALIRAPSQLPDLPATLVGLTSVSAVGYLGAKAASTNPPIITSVVITSQPSNGLLHAGDTVRITGSGFHPAQGKNRKDQGVLVLFNGVPATVAKPSDTALVATVPPGLVPIAGPHLSIEVQTSAGVVTPHPFTSLSLEGPRITSVSRTAGTIDVRGYGLSVNPQPAVTVMDQAGQTAVIDGRPAAIPADGQNPDNGQLTQDGQPAQHHQPGLRVRVDPAGHPPYKVTVTVSGASSSMKVP